jgi:inhibitor of KinA sporulation pathway (predicted exonuclease)
MNAKLVLPEQFVLFDLEWTTWEGAMARKWSGPGEHREVVQCGAVLVDENLGEVASFLMYVRPQINPELSQYFIDLTHITQAEVDEKGNDFATFLATFHEWCADFPIYSFSDHTIEFPTDAAVLAENCTLNGIDFPFDHKRFSNVNNIFHEHGIDVEQSGRAPEAFGLNLPARPHDALNDARGLLIGLQELARRVQ